MIFKKTANTAISSVRALFLPFMERILNDWIKLGVILMVLMGSIILGFMASPKWALMAGVLICGVIGFIILLRRPEIGVFLLLPISFFAYWELGTGTSVAFNFTFLLSIAIIGIWIFRLITVRDRSISLTNSISTLSILFLIATCLSLLAGQVRWVIQAQDQASIPAQIGGWLLYVLPIGVMLYVQTHLQDIRWLKILTWLFIGLGAIYISTFFLPDQVVSKINVFTLGSTESIFWTWLAALTFGQFLYNKQLRTRYKIALGLLTVAIVLAGLSGDRGGWVSGWMPPLLAMATILWLRSWRLGLVCTVLAVIVLGITNLSIVTDISQNNQYSIYSRFATFPIMFKLIQANPILGLGFANYSHYTSVYPILGWYVSFNSHNNYMDILAQTGIIGLVLFICLMIAIGLRGFNLHKLQLDGFSSGYINACLGGLVGMLASGMLGDWFLPYLYNIGITGFRSGVFAWIFLGGLLAIGQMVDKQKQGEPSTRLPVL